MGKVNFDVVFTNIGVNPSEYFFFVVEENHIFVDHEKTIMLGQGITGCNYFFSISKTSVCGIGLFQTADRLTFEIIAPYFLKVRFSFSQNNFGCAFERFFLSSFK